MHISFHSGSEFSGYYSADGYIPGPEDFAGENDFEPRTPRRPRAAPTDVEVGRGARWHRNYWKISPPEHCERCGKRAGETFKGLMGVGTVRIFWDHCHVHDIVRGALCNSCNADEGRLLSDLKRRSKTTRNGYPGLFWRNNRFTTWYKRCSECYPPTP